MKLSITVEKKLYNSPFVRFCIKWIPRIWLYVLSALVLIANFSLIFDNVLWGDEAFAANLIRNGDVAGIFQVLNAYENHPPLYYLWLKLFAEIFGYETWVYHLASFVPFAIGIIMALTLFKKHFGALPTAFYIILSGLSMPAVTYNQEVRMYELAFIGVMGAVYCMYRVLDADKLISWAGLVFFSLVAAYSHYYALVAVGGMLFVNIFAVQLKNKKKSFLKGIAALASFVLLYLPWLKRLLESTGEVAGNWWMDAIEPVGNSLRMTGCGDRMSRLVWLLAILVYLLVGVMDIAGEISYEEERVLISFKYPEFKRISAAFAAMTTGFATIAGTLIFAYGMSYIVRPLVSVRYFYALTAVMMLILVIGYGELLHRADTMDCPVKLKKNIGIAVRVFIVLMLLILFKRGIADYREFRAVCRQEDAATKATLEIIGDADENVTFLNYQVTHIGWTVLEYYYPEANIENGHYRSAEGDLVWYFTNNELTFDEWDEISSMGYDIYNYEVQQLSKYHFRLYRFTRQE